jgi:hypothetical protein
MRARVTIIGALLVLTTAAVGAQEAAASTNAVTQVRAVYRSVLTAEYFGPASGVCSHLTAAGVRSFTAGGAGSCRHAFDQEQHILRNKTKGVDDSGYTAVQWRQVVNSVMGHLKVSVHGSHAMAIGESSGIPGQTTLVRVAGEWLFNSYPPSIQP